MQWDAVLVAEAIFEVVMMEVDKLDHQVLTLSWWWSSTHLIVEPGEDSLDELQHARTGDRAVLLLHPRERLPDPRQPVPQGRQPPQAHLGRYWRTEGG